MRALLIAALNRVVGNEPRVPAAPTVVAAGLPASNVRRVLVLDANGTTIERRLPARREVKDELVTVVDEPRTIDRFVMADRNVPVEIGCRARGAAIDCDRFDPVNCVL
jgi:hypothetical protein